MSYPNILGTHRKFDFDSIAYGEQPSLVEPTAQHRLVRCLKLAINKAQYQSKLAVGAQGSSINGEVVMLRISNGWVLGSGDLPGFGGS